MGLTSTYALMTAVRDGVRGFLLAWAAGEGRKHLWRWWGGWESRSREAEAPACWVCRGGAHTAVVLKKLVSAVLGSAPLLFLQGLQKIIYSINPFIFHSISFLALSPFTCLLVPKMHSVRSSWVSHLLTSSLIQYLWFEVFKRAWAVGRSKWPCSTLAPVERDAHSSAGLANAWTTGILWGCIFSFHQFSHCGL